MDTIVDFINQNPVTAGLSAVAFYEALGSMLCRTRKDGLSDAMTLEEFLLEWYEPNVSHVNNVDQKTISERRRAMDYWKRLTGNPRIRDIEKEDLNRFVVRMRSETWHGKPLSNATINKHCIALQSLFHYVGPITTKFPDATELKRKLLHFPSVAHYRDVSWKTPALVQFEKVLEACEVAEYPVLPDIAPCVWWQSIYLFLYNTGVRKMDVMNARWSDIRDLHGHQVLVISCKREKRHTEKFIPLNSAAQAVLRGLPRNAEDDLIFPFPQSDGSFNRTRSAIVRESGIPAAMGTFHAVRRLVATTCPNAQKVLGHLDDATTRLHYQSIALVAQSLDTMQQPEIVRLKIAK